MIDIHTHIIYGVDDGSDTMEESVAILASAAQTGVTDVILTPHYIDCGEYDKLKVYNNFYLLKRELLKNNIAVNVYIGNEIAVYGNIAEILKDERVATLANSKYMLIEFPMNVDVTYVMDTIYEIKIKGLVPVIAHPERCECFRSHVDRVKEAVDNGALIQCNTGSMVGYYGSTAKKIVKKLLKANLVHFFASDAHSMEHNRYTDIITVETEVEKLVGRYAKNKLFVYNARCVLTNQDLTKE